MFIPVWLLVVVGVAWAATFGWAVLVARGRDPLPFPDPGSRIFSAATPEAKAAVVALMARHGVPERFRADSSGVLRSILWDGTIINCSPPEMTARIDGATSCIGLVAADPEAAAKDAAAFLQSRGFTARVVADFEPGLPIAFVLSDAMHGTVINFRKHLVHMPRPQKV